MPARDELPDFNVLGTEDVWWLPKVCKVLLIGLSIGRPPTLLPKSRAHCGLHHHQVSLSCARCIDPGMLCHTAVENDTLQAQRLGQVLGGLGLARPRGP